jgi:hypothetical protein
MIEARKPPMTLTLYYHPFSSFCQKVLIALYENETPFEGRLIDLGDADSRAELERVWPLAKFPVLRDEEAGVTVPESGLIIEYLAERHPGPAALVPAGLHAGIGARLWDRFFDNYVNVPMQKAMLPAIFPDRPADPGAEEAKSSSTSPMPFSTSGSPIGDGRRARIHDRRLLGGAPRSSIRTWHVLLRPCQPRRLFRAADGAPLVQARRRRGRPYRRFLAVEWPAEYA